MNAESNAHVDPPNGRDALVVVAHPDDEILWCGGLILGHPEWSWHIVTLCRRSDDDRAPKFRRVLELVGARGAMADLDDGPDQRPLDTDEVQRALEPMLPARQVDLVLTHGPRGEYTRHRRHEEVCRATAALWRRGVIQTRELRMFAFTDDERRHLPRAIDAAPLQLALDDGVFNKKRALITATYGFAPDSWEARATPRKEAFWTFDQAEVAVAWVRQHQEDIA